MKGTIINFFMVPCVDTTQVKKTLNSNKFSDLKNL